MAHQNYAARLSVCLVLSLTDKQDCSAVIFDHNHKLPFQIYVVFFPCSITYASVQGSDWERLWEGTVSHQGRAFRVASPHSPEPQQLQNMLCLYFPTLLTCQSNDSANSLGILVFVSRICQARSVFVRLKRKMERFQIAHVLHLVSPCIINCFTFLCWPNHYIGVIYATCVRLRTWAPNCGLKWNQIAETMDYMSFW